MLKDKLIAELRKKYPGLHASVLGLLADKLEATVTEESQIEKAITDLESAPIKPQDYAALLQREGDRRVTEAEKKWKGGKPAGQDNPDPGGTGGAGGGADDPQKDLAKQLQALTDKINGMEKERNQRTLSEQFAAKLKEKNIPLQFGKGVTLEKPEDLDSALQVAEQDFTALKQELVTGGMIDGMRPPGGGGAAGGDKAVTVLDADIKAWADKGKPAPAVAAK